MAKRVFITIIIMNRSYFYLLTTSASLGSLQFGILHSGYNIAVINNIQDRIPYRYGFINLLFPFGAIFGCFIGSSIANSYGRRLTILAMDLIFAIGSAMVISS